jgi:hypothetical protein
VPSRSPSSFARAEPSLTMRMAMGGVYGAGGSQLQSVAPMYTLGKSLARAPMIRSLFPALRRASTLGILLASTITAHVGAQSPSTSSSGTSAPRFPVTIRVDASRPVGALEPIWRFFGADEPNYATMNDGRKMIGELGALRPKQV